MNTKNHIFFMAMLIATNLSMTSNPITRKMTSQDSTTYTPFTEDLFLPETDEHTVSKQDQENNPTPACIKQFKQDHPCVESCCLTDNQEYWIHVTLANRNSRYHQFLCCQLQRMDPYKYQIPQLAVSDPQSWIDHTCHYPKRVVGWTLIYSCICCIQLKKAHFRSTYPEVFKWTETHKIDCKNRRIIEVTAPQSENMKRD